MLNRKWLIGVAALSVAGFGASLALSQNKADDKPAGQQPAMPPEMEAWMKAGTPGPMHKILNFMAGSWDCKVKHIEGEQVTEAAGSSESRWILGGRYLETSFKSDMMGMPFEGRGLDAYDNITGEFVGIWLDSMSTGVFVQKGAYDEAKKEFTYTGDMKDPVTKASIPCKSVVKITGDNSYVFTMYNKMADPKGDFAKCMEISYTRKGSAAASGE